MKDVAPADKAAVAVRVVRAADAGQVAKPDRAAVKVALAEKASALVVRQWNSGEDFRNSCLRHHSDAGDAVRL